MDLIKDLQDMAKDMCDHYCMYQFAVDQKAWEEDRPVYEEEEITLVQEHCENCPMLELLAL